MVALLALFLTLLAVGYAGWAGRSRGQARTLRDEMGASARDWERRGRMVAREWSRAAGELPPRTPSSGSREESV